MILCDVNIFVYAHRAEMPNHVRYLAWLSERLLGAEPFGVSPLVLSGFLRTVTHPKIFKTPTPLTEATMFSRQILESPNSVEVLPGKMHSEIFLKLCRETNIRGNEIPDAYHAALAIESGSEWITEDQGFSKFADLRWRRPSLS